MMIFTTLRTAHWPTYVIIPSSYKSAEDLLRVAWFIIDDASGLWNIQPVEGKGWYLSRTKELTTPPPDGILFRSKGESLVMLPLVELQRQLGQANALEEALRDIWTRAPMPTLFQYGRDVGVALPMMPPGVLSSDYKLYLCETGDHLRIFRFYSKTEYAK